MEILGTPMRIKTGELNSVHQVRLGHCYAFE